MGTRGEAGAHLLVGDTLFAGAIGRTDLPGGNYGVLMRSITDVLFVLGDDAIVHPGHGESTTISEREAGDPFPSVSPTFDPPGSHGGACLAFHRCRP